MTILERIDAALSNTDASAVGETASEYQLVETSKLKPHPRNPRLVIREDVVETIVAGLSGGFHPSYALQVWKQPDGDDMLVLSGHHRLEAAKRAGIKLVPCFVRSDLDEESAYMVLATANAQGELSGLEIGMHALHRVEKDAGGKGKKGGLREYARSVGKDVGYISRCILAATVVDELKLLTQVNSLLDKVNHLSAIHALPKGCWGVAVEKMVAGGWSAKDTDERVAEWLKVPESIKPIDGWLSADEALVEVINGRTTASKLSKVCEMLAVVVNYAKAHGLPEDVAQAFIKTKPTDPRAVDAFLQSLAAEAAKNENKWLLGNWRDHLASIEPKSLSLVLTDPPYGMAYQSNRRKVKHPEIAGDNSTEEFSDFIQAVIPLLADDAHVCVFVNWRNEDSFRKACESAGLVVKGQLIWVKDNHTAGDLEGAFAPKHENIIHAVKGSPRLFERVPDVIQSAKVATDRHPTEKPVDLLKTLIAACTVKGQVVCDAFGGVASTARAALDCGRRFWSCELDEKYYAVGAERLEK